MIITGIHFGARARGCKCCGTYIVLVLQQCTNRHNEVVQVAFACFTGKYSG